MDDLVCHFRGGENPAGTIAIKEEYGFLLSQDWRQAGLKLLVVYTLCSMRFALCGL